MSEGVVRKERIRNNYRRGNLQVASVKEEIKKWWLSWFNNRTQMTLIRRIEGLQVQRSRKSMPI